MLTSTIDDSEVRNVIFRIKRGLCGYVSYLAACEMNQAFSEYVLYEPILRILTAQKYKVKCEHECPGIEQPKKGARKRLDFYAVGESHRFALEVKWVKSRKLDIERDAEKLTAISKAEPDTFPLLCVFGRQSNIEAVNLKSRNFKEWGKPVYADLRKTKYGCRVFRLYYATNKRKE